MSNQSLVIARAGLIALFVGASAQATILNEYSDLSAWSSATTSPTTQNFSGLGSPYSGTASGITLNSVNYRGFYNESGGVGYDTYLFGSPSAGWDLGTGAYIMGGSNGWAGSGAATPDTGLRVDFSSLPAFNALSFDFSALRVTISGSNLVYSTVSTPIQLTLQVYEGGSLSDTRMLSVPVGTPAAGFYGFTTTGSISSIRLLISSPVGTDTNRVLLDNVAYAQIAASQGTGGGDPPPPTGAIPEPGSYLLCGAGLLACVLVRRNSR